MYLLITLLYAEKEIASNSHFYLVFAYNLIRKRTREAMDVLKFAFPTGRIEHWGERGNIGWNIEVSGCVPDLASMKKVLTDIVLFSR